MTKRYTEAELAAALSAVPPEGRDGVMLLVGRGMPPAIAALVYNKLGKIMGEGGALTSVLNEILDEGFKKRGMKPDDNAVAFGLIAVSVAYAACANMPEEVYNALVDAAAPRAFRVSEKLKAEMGIGQ